MIRQFTMFGKDMLICTGVVYPGLKEEFENSDRKGETTYLFYAYDENYSKKYLGDIYYDDCSFPVYSDTLYDMSFLCNKSFYGINKDTIGHWIAINCIPSNKKYNFEKIDGPYVKELPVSVNKRKILVLKGNPIINNVELEILKVGNVAAGKSINLNLKNEDKILLLEDI